MPKPLTLDTSAKRQKRGRPSLAKPLAAGGDRHLGCSGGRSEWKQTVTRNQGRALLDSIGAHLDVREVYEAAAEPK